VEFSITERLPSPTNIGLYQARSRLPPALTSRARGKRIAIVDDVMSAGSSTRATYAELRAHGAHPVVVGALLLLGSAGVDFFLQNGVAVEAVARLPFNVWTPAECALCTDGVPLEQPSGAEEGIDPPP
jgi:orotate phosphoribosyltransferase